MIHLTSDVALEHLHVAARPIVEGHLQHAAGALGRPDHRLALLGVARQRLLAEDMPAALERRDGDRRVQVVRHADADDVEVVAREQLPVIAVEVRHATWNSEAVLAEFAAARVAFCNIDQPLLGRAIQPTAHATSAIGYVRLHGRNYDQWFEHEKAHERYNYLYTEPQLEKWKDKIETIAGKTEMTFVIANNHFEGKAAVNVVQLRRMLGQKNLTVPETLVARYPVLAENQVVGGR